MQDRTPLHPGRVTLTPVAGQENTYDMVRADSPTQEGTPLNKNSLLKDTTAALYGLGIDAVPDDVLQKVAPMIRAADYQVGDIRETVRTDLGDSWLLCNGEIVLRSEYPDLAELAPLDYLSYQLSVRNIRLQGVSCYEGTWVAVGYKSNKPYIVTTTDPEGTWSEQRLSDAASAVPQSIASHEETWVAVGYKSTPYPYFISNGWIQLPSISVDDAYTYIKAKE